MTKKHALLSPSSAHRWLVCTPSARLEENVPDLPSEHAKEGTAAHTLAEVRLRQARGEKARLPNGFKDSPYYGQSMEDYIADYVAIVMERISEHKTVTADPVVLLEEHLDFSHWVPGGWGTGDVVIISDLAVEVIDLKYGTGVPVSAEGNPQTRLYGLGALNTWGLLYDADQVFMTIVQPRLDSISTEKLSVEALLTWAREEVEPKAALAYDGEGELSPGGHCRFCRIKATCRARAEANLELAKHEFAKPPTLSVDEIASILHDIDDLVSWAGDVKDYALDQAVNHGVKFPGWKVVEGRSNRKFSDEAEAQKLLLEAGFKADEIAPRKLLGVTALERLVGKKAFASHMADVIVKPPGKPRLAPEDDPRPELNSAAAAAADFAGG